MIKKIETQGHRKKKEKKRTYMGLIIAAILVLSTVGFTLMQGYTTEEKQGYNDHVFIKKGTLWQTQVDNNVIETIYLPQEVENITSKTSFIPRQIFTNKIIYFIAKTTEEKQASFKLSKYIPGLRMQYACFPGDNTTECQELPEKSCENITSDSVIVIIKDTSEEMYLSYVNMTINETLILNQTNQTEPIKNNTKIEEKYFLDYSINETRINYFPGCLEILAPKEKFTKTIEKAIFIMFGIIS